ncbi:glycosyltransferase family 4 protein [Candidatus Parcubacteria bacterium]|nr:glycosyltransferase family 4 protein [Candidatus Parcubacteria bacterium]
MIVGIDIRMLARGTRTGVEEYTTNFLANMLSLNKNIEYKLFYNGYKKIELDCDWLKFPNVELKQYRIPNRFLDTSLYFFNYPKIDKLLKEVDVFFSPHIFLSSVSKKCKSVMTFHDLSFEKYPEFYSASKNYWHFSMNPKKQARKTDKIIAVSESTKNDLVGLYNINPGKIKVIYSGINSVSSIQYSVFSISKIKKKYNLPEKYILYLGTLEPRKNIVGLIKAFEMFKRRRHSRMSPAENYKLVIAGSKGWLYGDIFKTVKNSPVKNDIIFTGFIDDEDKSILYSQAELFVYPSFYEGFGFPPLEAMVCGTPVITSNFSSLPEAVGDAAIMINPYNLDELYRAMETVLNDDKLKDTLIKRGFEQTKKFSWQKCARETLDFILE